MTNTAAPSAAPALGLADAMQLAQDVSPDGFMLLVPTRAAAGGTKVVDLEYCYVKNAAASRILGCSRELGWRRRPG